VLDDADARDLPAGSHPGDYFRQELVPGRYEYCVHILFIDGRIRRALCIEHDMAHELSVKGPLKPRRQRIVRCRHLPVFARILAVLEFEGLCNIDFKLRDGKPLVMEVNPRMGISLCPYFFAFVRSLPRAKR
jgi:predicted ATP-grasp superfamily ATP-dependent carboligase